MDKTALARAIYVTVPELVVTDHGDEIELRNIATATVARFGRDVLDLLACFERPNRLSAWLGQNKGSGHTLSKAISHAVLTDVDRMLTAAPQTIGVPSTLSDLICGKTPADTVVFGVPYDGASTGTAGARAGPSEIRKAFKNAMFDPAHATQNTDTRWLDFALNREFYGPVPRVLDLGALSFPPGEGIATLGPRIAAVCGMIKDAGAVPGLLGGDHSVTHFALQSLLQRHPKIGILHFDAHHDIWPPPAPQYSYVTHANALYSASQSDRVARLFQIGVRVFDVVDATRRTGTDRVGFINVQDVQRQTPEAVLAALPTDIPYYVTFDIDCIDPSESPETGTPEPGGLTYLQALQLLDTAARRFDVIGWDIVEVGQSLGPRNAAAACAAGLVRSLVLRQMQTDEIGGYTQ